MRKYFIIFIIKITIWLNILSNLNQEYLFNLDETFILMRI